jgi:hypothetical protein
MTSTVALHRGTNRVRRCKLWGMDMLRTNAKDNFFAHIVTINLLALIGHSHAEIARIYNQLAFFANQRSELKKFMLGLPIKPATKILAGFR